MLEYMQKEKDGKDERMGDAEKNEIKNHNGRDSNPCSCHFV